MPKPKKIEAVQSLKAKLQQAKSVVITEYTGMTVAEMTDLRARLRKEQVEFKVVKNRLAKIALREAGLNTMDDYLKGMKAIALGMNDPIAPAKVLVPYAKDNEKLKLVAGLMDNQVLSVEELVELSKLPSREVLLGRLVGSLSSPIQRLAFALHQTMAKVVYALDAVARKKAEQGG
ncbi:MAG: 50S ribosomal protein L10 [Candidatus Sumerlaea sp.]|uniref:Large ribosomal subunit protein uL10 n=1 Tax=Sumerlaea chitinivorans TaxID=2250252 RepID=A0A2Z4Y3N9_SUMC1|nr:LSU ribosomal protein L10p (P0) [Candidatus Sumerlaea chitinivorans]GIX44554.1 MAG: 50S ribosomal protein L10 [Candidatus Sumerlaea sp.]